jgi:hypothetical protein
MSTEKSRKKKFDWVTTPKAFANFSPGLERERQPWVQSPKRNINPERVSSEFNALNVLTLSGLECSKYSITQGCRSRSNPVLKLANAFSV